jgi:hypothetical protein
MVHVSDERPRTARPFSVELAKNASASDDLSLRSMRKFQRLQRNHPQILLEHVRPRLANKRCCGTLHNDPAGAWLSSIFTAKRPFSSGRREESRYLAIAGELMADIATVLIDTGMRAEENGRFAVGVDIVGSRAVWSASGDSWQDRCSPSDASLEPTSPVDP